jgi:hypothetical protein
MGSGLPNSITYRKEIQVNAIKTEALPTHGESVGAFNSCLKAFQDSTPLEEFAIKTAFLGIHHSLQVRDYAMGACGLVLTPADSITFLNLFKAVAGESAHVEAIKSAYAYELGDKEKAFEFLSNAFVLDRKNALMELLSRCFRAGWPADSFATLREELHPKVIEGLKALKDVKVDSE